jgi:hypothetical protein
MTPQRSAVGCMRWLAIDVADPEPVCELTHILCMVRMRCISVTRLCRKGVTRTDGVTARAVNQRLGDSQRAAPLRLMQFAQNVIPRFESVQPRQAVRL